MTRKLILSATLATLVATAAAGTALAADGRGMGMGDRGRDGHPVFGMLPLAIVAALAVLATWLVIRRRPTLATAGTAPAALQPSPTASAEGILAERLARSEISADDYRTTLAALRGSATPASDAQGPDVS